MKSAERTLDLNELKDLGKQLLQSGQRANFSLGGNSMYPYLRNGDVATVANLPMQDLKLGQIVVFEQQGKWIAHRLVAIHRADSRITLVSQGDSTLKVDSPIGQDDYLGVLESFSRNGERHQMNSFVARQMAWTMVNLRPIPQHVIRLYLRITNRLFRA